MKIILPDFLAYLPRMPSLPLSLQRLRAFKSVLRGRATLIPHAQCWQQLIAAPVRWPGAAPMTLAYDIAAAPPGYWLRADPVLLQPSLNNVHLLPSAPLAITLPEAEALIHSLNALFAEHGLTFYMATPQRWYVHCQTIPAVDFVDLAAVAGRYIADFLPSGSDALTWHRYLNEIQMLFHAHPVNTARAHAQRLPISGVWFWGGGSYPLPCPMPRQQHVYSDDEETVWQAKALGYPAHLFPVDLMAACDDDALWVINTFSAALIHTVNVDQPLDALEQRYLAAAVQALARSKISRLTLIMLGGEAAYHITTRRMDRWKFWRPLPFCPKAPV